MFRHHLIRGKPLRFVTDHQPSLYLMSSEGLRRFALVMQDYNFTIKHCSGVKHQNADTLSRHPVPSNTNNSGARLDEEHIPTSDSCQPANDAPRAMSV